MPMPTKSQQLAWSTQQLFSNNYLITRLPRRSDWDNSSEAVDLFQKVRAIFAQAGPLLDSANESQIQKRVIDPVLELINPDYLTGEPLKTGVIPDYVFFPERAALQRKDLSKLIAVADAKEPGTDFDKATRERSPTRQVYDYLIDSQVSWGFVSDGARWRLLNKDSPTDRFFEVDLRRIVDAGDEEGWLYFFNLFRREAFIQREGVSFLDSIRQQSISFAQEVGDELKGRVFRALEELSRGFVSWPENGLDPRNSQVLDQLRENCFILLYRLLFIFHAEARDLLPLKNSDYLDLSLQRLRERTAGASRNGSNFSTSSRQLWTGLRDLFRLIDRGNPRLGVTPYNGGLFSPQGSSTFLHPTALDHWDISDSYLARAIDLMGTVDSIEGSGETVFIDYSGLEIRHLGSIYEGLLEYRLGYAASDHIAVREGERDVWVPADKVPTGASVVPGSGVKAGGLFLETEKHERKASGSYYTPEPVVKYIVRSTLAPLIAQRILESKGEGRPPEDAILSIKVCDPAMGSGHFLVEAVEVLSDALLRAAEENLGPGVIRPENLSLEWAKREVVRHCIYGVDLNPLAVELAKVSLWLATVSKEKPLSFLDHRLKCGNSLVGTTLLDMAWLPGERPVGVETPVTQPQSLVKELIRFLDEIESGLEDTVEDVKKKERAYGALSTSNAYTRFKRLGDIHTGLSFIDFDAASITAQYMEIANEVVYGDAAKWARKTSHNWVREAERESRAHGAFHWQLEFADVMVNPARGPRSGFDAIIGNPPYVRVETANKPERRYLMESRSFRCLVGRFDLSLPFLEKGLKLSRPEGRFGMIVTSPILTTDYGEKIRKWLLSDLTLDSVVDFGELDVFPGVGVRTCILVIENTPPGPGHQVQVSSPESVSALGSQERPLPQEVFRQSMGATIRVGLTEENLALKRRIDALSIPLGQLCYCITGVVAHDPKTHESKDRLISSAPKNEWYRPYIEAKEWDGRYGWVAPTRFIEYRPDVPGHMHRPKFPELFSSPKIFIQGISGSRLIATLDRQGVIANHSMLCCLKAEDILHVAGRRNLSERETEALRPDARYDLRYLLGLLCSRLMGFYYAAFLQSTTGISPDTVGVLPILRVDFDLASEKVTTSTVNTLTSLENDPEKQALEFDSVPSAERGKVAHDYICDAVSRLIENNRIIQAERRGFLGWLKQELGTDPLSLSGRTELRTYDSLSFDRLLGVLKKNRSRLTIDPSSRAFQERLQVEFSKSLERIRPRRAVNEAADSSIDRLIYQLYGLSEEDTSMVQGVPVARR